MHPHGDVTLQPSQRGGEEERRFGVEAALPVKSEVRSLVVQRGETWRHRRVEISDSGKDAADYLCGCKSKFSSIFESEFGNRSEVTGSRCGKGVRCGKAEARGGILPRHAALPAQRQPHHRLTLTLDSRATVMHSNSPRVPTPSDTFCTKYECEDAQRCFRGQD